MTLTEAQSRAADTIEDADEEGDELADQTRSAAGRARVAVMGAFEHVPDLLANARSGAEQVAERLPDAVDRARVGAHGTALTMQTMSDTTLRLLAAGSLGLAAGLFLAGAKRPITLIAAAPALIAGSAIATRPGSETGRPAHAGGSR
jgi:hypothetical protein